MKAHRMDASAKLHALLGLPAAPKGSLSRKDIDELLWNKLPDWMDDKQRKIKVGNLVAELRRAHKIANQGSDTRPSWALVKS